LEEEYVEPDRISLSAKAEPLPAKILRGKANIAADLSNRAERHGGTNSRGRPGAFSFE
jgi:hypothetical protein